MSRLSFGEYSLDTQKGRLYQQDQPLELEPQIYGILELLISRHGDIVSRDDMINAVWDGRLVSNNVIDNRIKSARSAIGDSGKNQRWIKTYPNRGYKFIGAIRVVDETTEAVDAKSSASLPVQERSVQEPPVQAQPPRKSPSFVQKTTALKLAAMALVGVFGFFILSQSTRSGITQTPLISEASEEAEVYRLATSDDPDALPRIAVLPVEAIGEKSDYGFLPDVIKGEINHTITAIDSITVVSLSSSASMQNDFRDYKILREGFALDYAIAAKITPYGQGYKLNASLIRTEDGTVLFNQPFDLPAADQGKLQDLPGVIARKVTLMTANKLNLSVETLPPSWENYGFYAKFKKALLIAESEDYEDIVVSIELLREIIEEEPNYVPAHSKLREKISWKRAFLFDGYEALVKEEAELARKMNEISPESPETLLMNAGFAASEGGVDKTSLGEYNPTDPTSVIKYILKNDPDNRHGHRELAYISFNTASPPKAAKDFEKIIRLFPTDAKILTQYSSVLFCNTERKKARSVLDRTKHWHPDHRRVLVAEIKQAKVLGDYQTALIDIRKLLDKGYINAPDADAVSELFIDLGHPELALPHVRVAPTKALLYAQMEDRDAALKEAREIERFYTSVRARMIADWDYFPTDYAVNRTYMHVGRPGDKTKANGCRLHQLIRDAYVLKKIESKKYESFLSLLTDYFNDRKVEDFVTQQDFTTLMGLHVLQGDYDKAIGVMDAAMARGFIFIGALKEPYLRELTTHPGFAERLDAMQKSADLLIERYYQVD